jgi:hypothetical protein
MSNKFDDILNKLNEYSSENDMDIITYTSNNKKDNQNQKDNQQTIKNINTKTSKKFTHKKIELDHDNIDLSFVDYFVESYDDMTKNKNN